MTAAAKRSKTPAIALPVAVLMAVAAIIVFSGMHSDPGGASTRNTGAAAPVATVNVSTSRSSSASTTPAAGPDAEALRKLADYVSPDGRYVKIGPVEISTTGPVSRAVATP